MKKTFLLLSSLTISLQAALAQTAVSPRGPTPAPPAASGPETGVTAAQDASWMRGKYGLGSMYGMRADLYDAGIEPFLYYTAILSGNPVGGRKQGATYIDDFYFGANLYLDKLVGWKGAKLTLSGVNRDGLGLTEHYVGSRYDVQQAVGGQNFFVYQVFLEQKFWDDKASLKLGRFGASDDFNGSKIYGLYLNNGIDGDIRNVLFDTQFSAYPFATWAARLRVDPTPEWDAQVGIFQTWNDIFDRTHNGLNWGVRGDDGVFLIGQVGWSPEFWKQSVPNEKVDGKTIAPATESKGLPGHYWIGGSYSPWSGYTEFGTNNKRAGSYGFYVHGDQMIYQERPGSDQGLTLWAASGLYPQPSISIVPFQVNVGLVYKGLIPCRDEDQTTFGFIYGNFSEIYARTVKVAGNGEPTYESVLEFGHRIQLTKFAFIQPDLQWVIRPGGTGRIDDALVVGAEMGITF
jgi:porin